METWFFYLWNNDKKSVENGVQYFVAVSKRSVLIVPSSANQRSVLRPWTNQRPALITISKYHCSSLQPVNYPSPRCEGCQTFLQLHINILTFLHINWQSQRVARLWAKKERISTASFIKAPTQLLDLSPKNTNSLATLQKVLLVKSWNRAGCHTFLLSMLMVR